MSKQFIAWSVVIGSVLAAAGLLIASLTGIIPQNNSVMFGAGFVGVGTLLFGVPAAALLSE